MQDNLIRCKDCQYWSGHPGNNSKDLVCAVRVPQPTLAALEWVDGRTASALHNCPDFEPIDTPWSEGARILSK